MHRSRSTRGSLAVGAFALAITAVLAGKPAEADWLVYIGGGIQETAGPWKLKGRQVVFQTPTGTLFSVRADDVDLPSSAFVSWQMSVAEGKKPSSAPGASAQQKSPTPPKPPAATPCVPSRVVRVASADTLEIEIGGKAEVIHLAGFDGAEIQHRFPEFAWFGKRSADTVLGFFRETAAVCLFEETPPRRDQLGHRLLYLRLANGGDLGTEMLNRGLGIARDGAWARGDEYRDLESRARSTAAGHWGEQASQPTMSIVLNNLAKGAGPAPPRAGSA